MRKLKHTPGPLEAYDWAFEKTDALKAVGITCGTFPNGHETGLAYGHTEEEAFANAKLYAAAPEMLKFIMEIAERYENSPWIASEANSLIKKAVE